MYIPPEPARDGGRMGPDDPGRRRRGMDILVEGVGGRMLEAEEAADGAEVLIEALFLKWGGGGG